METVAGEVGAEAGTAAGTGSVAESETGAK